MGACARAAQTLQGRYAECRGEVAVRAAAAMLLRQLHLYLVGDAPRLFVKVQDRGVLRKASLEQHRLDEEAGEPFLLLKPRLPVIVDPVSDARVLALGLGSP